MQGNTLLSTSQDHVSFAAYQAAVSETVYPIKIDLSVPEAQFRGTIASRDVGRVSIIHARANSSFRCVRRPSSRAPGNNAFLLQLQRAGITRNEQAGVSAYCAPGTMVLLDARDTVTAEQIGSADALVMRIPAELLLAHFPDAACYCATTVAAESGSPHILAAMMEEIWNAQPDLTEGDQTVVPLAAVRLVETAFRSWADGRRNGDGSDRRFDMLKQAVADNCFDADLNVDALARMIGMSRRSLYSLSQKYGTSAERMIITARLEHVEARLRDPLNADCNIAELASQAGFVDFSHFCRRFKAHYGSAPGEYRRRALSAD